MKTKLIKTIDEQGVMYSLSGDNLPENYVLSDKNCQAIELGYDLDELAKEELLKAEKHHKLLSPITYRDGVIKGFQKALSILGDKKFSEEDVKKVIFLCCNDADSTEETIFKSLQQTEFDVEIVMEDSKVVESHVWDGSNDGELTWKKQPLFDVDGCLILKRK